MVMVRVKRGNYAFTETCGPNRTRRAAFNRRAAKGAAGRIVSSDADTKIIRKAQCNFQHCLPLELFVLTEGC